jgi:hypothetical protein
MVTGNRYIIREDLDDNSADTVDSHNKRTVET